MGHEHVKSFKIFEAVSHWHFGKPIQYAASDSYYEGCYKLICVHQRLFCLESLSPHRTIPRYLPNWPEGGRHSTMTRGRCREPTHCVNVSLAERKYCKSLPNQTTRRPASVQCQLSVQRRQYVACI